MSIEDIILGAVHQSVPTPIDAIYQEVVAVRPVSLRTVQRHVSRLVQRARLERFKVGAYERYCKKETDPCTW